MKSTFLCSVFLLIAAICPLRVSAEKLNVMVHPTTGEKISNSDINKIHSQIVTGLTNIPTINLFDESNDGAKVDKHFQCNIDSIEIYPRGTGQDKHYVTIIHLCAYVYDKGQTIKNAGSYGLDVFSSLLLASHKTQKESANSALEWIPERVERAYWKPFAVQGKLLEISEVKKDKAQKVTAGIGSLSGAEQGQSLDVYLPDPKIRDKNGDLKDNKPIGKVKIEDLGEEITVCKVTGGSDKIYAAYLEDPNQLTVMSKGPSKGLIKDGKYKAQVGAEYAFYLQLVAEEALGLYKEVSDSIF